VAGKRVFLELRDICILDAREIIVRFVVLAHMIDAEAEIFAFLHPADRRTMRAGQFAAFPLALWLLGLAGAICVRPDADAVEKF
jgi:hypothetical protein